MLAMETFRINASIYWIPIVAIPGIHFSFDFYVILQHLRFSPARQRSPPLRPPLQSDQLNIKESILSLLVRRERKNFSTFLFFPPVKILDPSLCDRMERLSGRVPLREINKKHNYREGRFAKQNLTFSLPDSRRSKQ